MPQPTSLRATFALLVLFSAGCLSRSRGSRCKHDLDCAQGLVCSNERNRQNDGVCIRPCEPHIAAAACPSDAGADARSDARSDGAADGAAEAGVLDATADVFAIDALDARAGTDVLADTYSPDVPTDNSAPGMDVLTIPDADNRPDAALSENPLNGDVNAAESGSDL